MLTIDYKLLDLKEGETILDVGCGEGRHTWEASKKANCRVYGLDLGKENLGKACYTLLLMKKNGECLADWALTAGDALNLPFRDASFDKVICSEVLEHVKDDRLALKELVRVLRPEGSLAVSVPSFLTETVCWKISLDYHNQPGGHIRIYKARQVEKLLNSEKLVIFARRNRHGLHSFYWILKCVFGAKDENAFIPGLYHRFLVWDMKTRLKPIQWLDAIMNALLPKSMVFYARKGRE